jgi:protein-disulfide isomerase
MKEYIENGKIRYAIVDMPLLTHKLASKAAEGCHCAGEQGKYWEMREQMMAKQEGLENLTSYAAQVGLDITRFEDCLKIHKYSEGIAKDRALAGMMKISSVPIFVLCKTDLGNPLKFKGISFIAGAQPFSSFQKEIDNALADLDP